MADIAVAVHFTNDTINPRHRIVGVWICLKSIRTADQRRIGRQSRHADLSLEALNANKKFNDAIKNCIKLTD